MDFLRSYFFKNEPLDQLPISFIKIRFSCNQNIGETLTRCKKSVSNVLITGESNFDEINGQLIRGSYLKRKDGGSPDARLRLARHVLVRLRLNDGAKLWVSFKLCFKTNDFYRTYWRNIL